MLLTTIIDYRWILITSNVPVKLPGTPKPYYTRLRIFNVKFNTFSWQCLRKINLISIEIMAMNYGEIWARQIPKSCISYIFIKFPHRFGTITIHIYISSPFPCIRRSYLCHCIEMIKVICCEFRVRINHLPKKINRIKVH